MQGFREDIRLGYLLAIIIGAGMILGGCAATINYSYDPMADFSKLKSYRWATELSPYRQESLVEKNVRYYADQSLKNKGFSLTSDKADFSILINYELEYSNPYKLQILSLYIYRMPGMELIWQGTAEGAITDIRADAASQDLSEAVKKILMSFPPKR